MLVNQFVKNKHLHKLYCTGTDQTSANATSTRISFSIR